MVNTVLDASKHCWWWFLIASLNTNINSTYLAALEKERELCLPVTFENTDFTRKSALLPFYQFLKESG